MVISYTNHKCMPHKQDVVLKVSHTPGFDYNAYTELESIKILLLFFKYGQTN